MFFFFFEEHLYFYEAFKKAKRPNDAEKECHSWGGHLLSIHNSNENEIVKQLLLKKLDISKGVLIGLQRLLDGEEPSWKWTDGTMADFGIKSKLTDFGPEHKFVVVNKDGDWVPKE